MKVEVFYFSGCPNHQPTVDRVRQALSDNQIPAQIVEVEVKDDTTARAVQFPGSPTVRINGVDIEAAMPGVKEGALCCRTYLENGKRSGVPSEGLIRRALGKFDTEEKESQV